MLDLFKDISYAQWIMIVIGIIFIMLSFKSEFFNAIGFFTAKKKQEEIKLTAIVAKWERLRDACHEAGLHKACDKLDEVFPMLVEVTNE